MQETETSEGIIIYGGATCYYCVAAKQLLDRKGVPYVEIKVDATEGMREEMERRSRRRTLPQIFIGGLHIGGFDDMTALDRAGKLDPLLEPFKKQAASNG